MRWPTAGLGLLLLVLTGCMEDFARNGRIDKAVHKDVMERLRKNCAEDIFRQLCPLDQEPSEACLKQCGGQ